MAMNDHLADLHQKGKLHLKASSKPKTSLKSIKPNRSKVVADAFSKARRKTGY